MAATLLDAEKPVIHIYLGTKYPDISSVPIDFGMALAWAPALGEVSCFKKIRLDMIERSPTGLYFAAMQVGYGYADIHRRDHPGHTYIIHALPTFITELEGFDKHQLNGWVDKDGKPVAYKGILGGLGFKAKAANDVKFEALTAPSDANVTKAIYLANRKFIERVSTKFHFPTSTIIMPVHSLHDPIYEWNLGNGESLCIEKTGPYEADKVVTHFILSTPAFVDFDITRFITVKDKRTPKNPDEFKKKRSEREEWKEHKKEVKKEYNAKRLRSD